jgi:hypothetical protein
MKFSIPLKTLVYWMQYVERAASGCKGSKWHGHAAEGEPGFVIDGTRAEFMFIGG